MRKFLMAALAMGSLLATASAQAHTLPVHRPAPALVAVTCDVSSVAAFTGPVVSSHPSVSVHPSFGGGFHSTPSFHATPTYRSFSPAVSRTFTFSSRPAPTYSRPATSALSTRPATTYSRPAPVVNHYHAASTGSGGGGLSIAEAILLHQALSSSGNSSPPAPAYRPNQADTGESWELAPLIGLGIVVIIGGGLLIHIATRQRNPAKRVSSGYTPIS